MPNLVAFISYVLITTFTPGPNNIMSMSNASRYGFKKSIKFNIGVFWGFFMIIALSSVFSFSLNSMIPSFKLIMMIIGALYILLLAWKIFTSKPHNNTDEKGTNSFLSGLLLQFVNPKGILFGITTVSTFIVPYYHSMISLIAFSVMLAFVGFIATCSWSFFGSIFQKYLAKNQKLINVIMSILLVYCAVSLFL